MSKKERKRAENKQHWPFTIILTFNICQTLCWFFIFRTCFKTLICCCCMILYRVSYDESFFSPRQQQESKNSEWQGREWQDNKVEMERKKMVFCALRLHEFREREISLGFRLKAFYSSSNEPSSLDAINPLQHSSSPIHENASSSYRSYLGGQAASSLYILHFHFHLSPMLRLEINYETFV